MNKKLISSLIIMLTGSFLAGWFGPWWAMSVYIILVVALLKLPVKPSLLLGALSIGIVFLGMALFTYSNDEAEIISKTGMLLGGLSPIGMLGFTTFIGILTGVCSAWLGSALGSFIKKL